MNGKTFSPPRHTNVRGQPHMLAYINDEEASLLKALGGAGKPVHGVPAFYDEGDGMESSGGDQSAGPDGNQGTGNNNAGPSSGGGREDGMDRDDPSSSSSSNNQAANDAVAAGKAEADSWSDWANTVGQNYANTQNQSVDQMGNITTNNPDGSTTTTLSQAQQDLNVARDTNNSAGKLADRIQAAIDSGQFDPNEPMDNMNVSLAMIGTGLVDNKMAKSERLAALEEFGRRTAMAGQMKGGYNFGFMGPPNVNDILNNNPDMTQKDVVEAMARGFNNQTGTKGIGYNAFGKQGTIPGTKGLFGDVFGIDVNGNLGIRSGWQNVGQNMANIGKTGASVLAAVKGNPNLAAAIQGFNFNTMAPLSNYDYTKENYDPNAPKGANMNMNYNVTDALLGKFADPITSKALGPLAKGIYGATNNIAITGASIGKVQDALNQEIRGVLSDAGVKDTVNVGSISMDTGQVNGPNNTSGAGKGAAPKGSATADLQSDISSQVNSAAQQSLDSKSSSNFSVESTASGKSGNSTSFSTNNKSGSIPSNTTSMAGTSNVSNSAATYNDKDGNMSPISSNPNTPATNNDNDNDNAGESWKLIGEQIQNIINEGQNSSSNVLNPISYNSPASTRGGGLRGMGAGMLTRGKNRDYGSATFRTASKNEIDRGARRSGFGNGIMFG